MSDPYLYYKSIKDTPVCRHLDFNCLKLKYEVLKLGVWMSEPYLYYNSIKDTHVCGHLDFNSLKLKYGVNHDILLFILAPGYTVSQGFSWTEIYFGHFVQAAPILFGHLEFF